MLRPVYEAGAWGESCFRSNWIHYERSIDLSLFSTTCALLFHSLAKSESLTSLFSMRSALFAEDAAVCTFFHRVFHSHAILHGHRICAGLPYLLRHSSGEPLTGFGTASSR